MKPIKRPDHPKPPRWATTLLDWLGDPSTVEEVQGDLLELYAYWVKTVGVRKARWRYGLSVLKLLRPLAKRNKANHPPFFLHPAMIRNYLTIAWRNLIRNKTFSLINIAGLALGMASSLLILLWIQDELRIGRQNVNAATLYRVMEHETTDGQVVTDEDTPGILADALKKEFPEVVYAAGLSGKEEHVLTVGDKVARQAGHFVGNDWLTMYSLPLVAGSANTALRSPTSLVISKKLAEIYFGDPKTALGKSIRFDNRTDYQVTAVFDNLPVHSLDQYDFLLNWEGYLKREPWLQEWENAGPRTRLLLRADANPDQFNAKLKTFLKGRNKDIGPNFNIELFLQPETEAYLYSHFKNGQRDGGRIEYVRLFSIVAVFLLFIACINFMNLATARSVKRAREVGVRKVVGAERSSLIGQFMGEALLLTTLSLGLALGLVLLTLPVFNQLTGKHLGLPLGQPVFWAVLCGLLIGTGGLAGSYPALFLSSLHPVRVLKGALRFGAGAQLFRRGLVVFQFVLSMLLIIGTVVIYRQLQYIQTKNLGYERANLIRIPSEGEIAQKFPLFKQELQQLPGIQAVSTMQTNPLYNGNTTEGVSWTGKDPSAAISFNNTAVGYDFARTMNVKFVRGRDFSPGFGTDSTNYLINEAAAKRMGYKDPVGQPLTFWQKPGKIIGLIEDFHFNSLHDPIKPLIIRLANNHYGNILIRTQPGQTRQALASIEALCQKLNPTFPFTYSFVDTDYAKLYTSETVVGTLSTFFAMLAIFIACLGLFGLAAFMAEQRTKEIGVRKVLGASVASLITLLSQDFLKLVLIAIVIASPLAWVAMNRWLAGFAYKIAIEWWVFALAGLLSVGIALLTVSFQSIKAALMNPVKSLRSE
ncbi:ABC transporter permease [Larkinella sp. C7]|jgi:putative ABC transport system permease protein|uniref:ABC transporter permease n=1 Tax=Larkinella sp. C7 TaxID=2576607 RepID=UPI001E619E8A|nr:ABC transporter permease [Larkinella sp. C7]